MISGERHGKRAAAEAGEQDQRGQRDGEQRGAAIVERGAAARAGARERPADDQDRQNAERQVDVEDPAPAQMLDEIAADQRPEHGRDAEHAADQTLIPAALARRDDVADHRHRRDHQPAAAEPLHGAERDQLAHRAAEAAQRRADEKQHDRRLQHDLAAEQIAELAVERRHDRRREQIGRDDPRQMRQPAELADDRRQRRRNDRLVERGEQHDQHQRRENDPDRLGARRGAGDRRRGCLIGHKAPEWLETTLSGEQGAAAAVHAAARGRSRARVRDQAVRCRRPSKYRYSCQVSQMTTRSMTVISSSDTECVSVYRCI